MKNFNFYNPTKIYFGKDETDKIGKLCKEYGNNVLLVYGKTAIKRIGLYDRVINSLKKENINVFELPGIDPNPRIESIREGGKLCKNHKIDLVLAVGGGSVIDASKGIASAALYEGDPWDFYSYKAESNGALPIASILTLSATGSEMNGGSVVTNFATKEKNGWGSQFTNPKFSILDPANTFSVSKHQTACGIVDSLTHVYEYYFSSDQSFLNDRICEGIMKTVIHFGPIALKEPNNFEARSNLMFSSTLALNGLSGFAKTWDGFNHTTEHLLSAYYDIAHADGLAILAPHWMEKILNEKTLDKFYEFAVNVWGVEESDDKMSVAKEGINQVYKFYESIKMPLTLREVDIIDPPLEELAKRATKNGTIGRYLNLDYKDVLDILTKSL